MQNLYLGALLICLLLFDSCKNSNDVISNSRFQKRKYNSGWYVEKSSSHQNKNSKEIKKAEPQKQDVAFDYKSTTRNDHEQQMQVSKTEVSEEEVDDQKKKSRIACDRSKKSTEEEIIHSQETATEEEENHETETASRSEDDPVILTRKNEENTKDRSTRYLTNAESDDYFFGEKKKKKRKVRLHPFIEWGLFFGCLSSWCYGWVIEAFNIPILGLIFGVCGIILCFVGFFHLKKSRNKGKNILAGCLGILAGLLSVIVCIGLMAA